MSYFLGAEKLLFQNNALFARKETKNSAKKNKILCGNLIINVRCKKKLKETKMRTFQHFFYSKIWPKKIMEVSVRNENKTYIIFLSYINVHK